MTGTFNSLAPPSNKDKRCIFFKSAEMALQYCHLERKGTFIHADRASRIAQTANFGSSECRQFEKSVIVHRVYKEAQTSNLRGVELARPRETIK